VQQCSIDGQPTFSSGFIGGVEGGLRYQLGKLVVGTEADITWGSVNGTSTTNWVPLGVLSRSISADTNWIATATNLTESEGRSRFYLRII
jgi:hypothetical protein